MENVLPKSDTSKKVVTVQVSPHITAQGIALGKDASGLTIVDAGGLITRGKVINKQPLEA
jgi:hypothetical protein